MEKKTSMDSVVGVEDLGVLDYCKITVQVLLSNEIKLSELCKKAQDYPEFPKVLLDFFLSRNKGEQLIKWAIQKDIQTTSRYIIYELTEFRNH